MKRCRHNTIWISVAALAVAGVAMASAQEAAQQTVFAEPDASCIVRITSTPGVLPISEAVARNLLLSTTVSGEPARAKFKLTGEDVGVFFEALEWTQSRVDHILIGKVSVYVHKEQAESVADEFLAEVCRRLGRALQQAGALDEERMRQRLAVVEAELEHVGAEFKSIRATQQELFQQAGQDDLSHERILDTIRNLEDQKHDLELELAGQNAREAALTEQIAKISAQVQEALEHGAVAAELNKVVELRETRLERRKARAEALFGEGMASSTGELSQLEEEAAMARAELARYRESISERVGGGLLAELNKELVQLSIQTAELEAASAHIGARLSGIRKKGLLELADRYEREVQIPLKLADRLLQELALEQQALKGQLRSVRRPEVLVIGGS